MGINNKSGFYLWFYHFNKDFNVSSFLNSTKNHILQNYLDNVMPDLIKQRAEAAFGNKIDSEKIDDFFMDFKNHQGYINKLQKASDELCSEYLSDFQVFVNGPLNNLITRIVSSNGGKITEKDLISQLKGYSNDKDKQYIQAREALDDIVTKCDKMIQESKKYLIYVASTSTSRDKQRAQKIMSVVGPPPRGWYSFSSVQAKEVQNQIKELYFLRDELMSKAPIDENGMVTKSFSDLNKFLKAGNIGLRSRYMEKLAVVAGQSVQKADSQVRQKSQEIIQQVGTKHYNPAKNGIGVVALVNRDKRLQALDNKTSIFGNITSKNDVYLTATIDGVSGEFGANVKSYRLDNSSRFQGFQIFDSGSARKTGSIFQFASNAVSRGLPFREASEEYIVNLGGALYGSSGPSAWNNYLTQYLDLIVQLNTVDAIMGRMEDNKVNNKYGNSLVGFDNNNVYYIPDMLKKITKNGLEGFQNSVQGAAGSSWRRGKPTEIRYELSEVSHYEGWIGGKTSLETYNIVKAQLMKVQLKIAISMNNILKNSLL